jgi:MFS family permease
MEEPEQPQQSSITTPDNSQGAKAQKVPLWTRAYVLILILNFTTFLGMWMLPNFLPVYIQSLGAPDWMLGWLTGVTSIASIIARPVSGRMVDHLSRRGVCMVGVIGMALTCVGFIFMPVVAAILGMRFVQGLFWGTTNTSCTTIATDVLPKARFAEGMGYFGMGSSLALIIAPALSLWLYYGYGEQFSVGVTAVFFLVSFVLSFFVAVRKPVRKPAAAAPVATSKPSAVKSLAKSLFERAALPGGIMIFFFAFSQGVQQSYLPVMCTQRGLQDVVGLYFIASAIFSLAGRPILGRWADRQGYTGPTIFACVCLTAAMAMLSQTYNTPVLIIAGILQGLGYSSGFSLFISMATRNAPLERRGVASATAMVGFDIGNGLGAVLLGSLVSIGGYSIEFIGAAVFAAVALVMYFAVVRKRVH